jgi:hypothetical protein
MSTPDTTENNVPRTAQEIDATARAQLEAMHGQVWDTAEMQRDFEVTGFSAPFVVVTRKSDGKRGALEFQHRPRFYYDFKEG